MKVQSSGSMVKNLKNEPQKSNLSDILSRTGHYSVCNVNKQDRTAQKTCICFLAVSVCLFLAEILEGNFLPVSKHKDTLLLCN